MTARPLPFTRPMALASWQGRKTQTRRVLKGDPPKCPPLCHGTMPCGICNVSLPYAPGDWLWVQETWRTDASMDALKPKKIEAACLEAGYRRAWAPIQYEADGARDNFTEGEPKPGKTRVAIHMPRWASRLTLIVEAVKVERLTDISEADAQAEGVASWRDSWTEKQAAKFFMMGTKARAATRDGGTAQRLFHLLWESINGAGSWDENPWIVAVQFRVVRANIDAVAP